MAGGINWQLFCDNQPINCVDPFGLWNLWNPASYFMKNDAGMNWSDSLNPLHRSAEWAGRFWALSEASASTLDGLIPFWDPFEIAYTDECGSREWYFDASRTLGALARDAYLIGRIPNIGAWGKNPVLYEIGQTTIPMSTYAPLKGLSAIERGRRLVQAANGNYLTAMFNTSWGNVSKTIGTGLTPGGWLLGVFGLEASDATSR